MLSEIKIGDKIKCLDCGEVITIEEIKFTFDAEYIVCPKCGKFRDIQYYHMFGEKVDGE